MLNLGPLLDKPVRTLSLGQRVRCDIVAGLLHQPSILYLDEPTIGLDYRVKDQLYDFLEYCNSEFNTTIILTSHDLEDVEKLCDRVAVLDSGRCVLDEKMDHVLQRLGGDGVVRITYEGESPHTHVDFGNVVAQDSTEVKVVFNRAEFSDLEVFNKVSGLPNVSNVSIERIELKEVLASLNG